MGVFESSLDHLKNHVQYPASRDEVVQACNNMADFPADDRDWFNEKLPTGTYDGPSDVLTALLGNI